MQKTQILSSSNYPIIDRLYLAPLLRGGRGCVISSPIELALSQPFSHFRFICRLLQLTVYKLFLSFGFSHISLR